MTGRTISWRTSTASATAFCVQAMAMEPPSGEEDFVRDFGWLAGAIDDGRPAEPPQPPQPPAPPPPAPMAPPWFTEEDALGDTAVERVDLPADEATAAAEADRVVRALPREVTSQVRAAIKKRLTEALRPSDAATLAADEHADRDRWTNLLQSGQAFAVDGHLVWLHPVLRDFRHLPPGPGERPREYPVTFGGLSASRYRETETTRGYETAVNSIFGMASSVLSSIFMGLPRLRFSSSSRRRHEAKVQAIAGRKTISEELHSFAAGVDFHVFVDGRRAHHDVVLPEVVRVPFPRAFLRPGGAVPPARPPAHVVSAARARAASRFHMVVGAVGAEPVGVELQQRLLAAGLPAKTVAEILTDLLPTMFDEQSLKNGSRAWTTSGRTSDPVHARTGLARSFRGHVRAVWRLRRLEYEDEAPGTIRDDLGLLGTRRSGRSFASSFEYTHGVQAGGIHHPGLFGKGYLHAGMSLKWSRSHSMGADAEWLPKATLMRKTRLARYRAVADLAIEVESSTHRVDPFEVPVVAEIAVPHKEARDFETALLGEVRSAPLRAYDTDVAAGTPAMRTLTDLAAPERGFGFRTTRLPGGSTVRTPEELEEFARRSPEPLMIRRSAWTGEEPPAWRTALGLAASGRARLYAADYTELDATGAPAPAPVPNPARHQFVIGAAGEVAGPFPPGRVLHDPDPREPPALAAGVGTGLGHETRLPGSERVLEEIRGFLLERVKNAAKAQEWGQVSRELDVTFGTTALEADLTAVLTGIEYNATLGGHTVDISVTGELGRGRGADEHDLTVNARSVAGEGASADRGDAWEASLKVDGRARLGDLSRTNIEIGKVSAGGGYGRSKGLAWSAGSKGYRRTETDGPAVEIIREMRYRVDVRIKKKTAVVARLQRLVTGDELVARVAVPVQHQPETPPRLTELTDLGRLVRLPELPPADRVTDLSQGAPGLYSAIVALPRLALVAGERVARLAGGPRPRERWDVSADIRRATTSSFLEANIAALTSENGMFVDLFEQDGWSYSLQLKARAVDTRRVWSGEVELEHYASGNARLGTSKGTDRTLVAAGTLGLRVRTKVKTEDGEPGEAVAGETRRGTDQVKVQAVGQKSVKWSDTDTDETGGIDVSRVTYAGLTHTYRSGLVFEISAVRSKSGQVRRGEPVVFEARDAMDFMVPDRLAADLALPRPSADLPEPVTRTYLDPDLALGSSYPELLGAERVMPRLVALLRRRGALAASEETTDSALMQVLRARYSQEGLRRQHLTLFGTGVLAWLPLDVGFGATRYLGVRVRGELLPTTDARHRPDAKLMLRSQGIETKENKRHRSVTTTAEGVVYGAGYKPERFGGGSGQVGRTWGKAVETAKKVNVKDISRVTARDRSYEFNHEVRYTIELVGTTEPPPGVRQLASVSRRGLLGIGDLLGSDVLERFWYRRRTIWTEDADGIAGSARLLVPEHVTAASGGPAAGRRPVTPEDVRWDEVRPSPVEAELAPLIGQVHFAAAPLVGEWAPYVTIPLTRRPGDPLAATRPPGFELSTGRGIRVAGSAGSTSLRAQVRRLLAHTFRIPLAKGDVTVGIALDGAVKLTEAELKGRNYVQKRAGGEHKEERSSGWDVRFDALGGKVNADTAEEAEAMPYDRSWGGAEGVAAETSNILERNSESTRLYDYYAFDLTLALHGPSGSHLAMRVPRGLIGRLARSEVRRLKENEHFAGFFREKGEGVRPNVVTDAAGLRWTGSSASAGEFCVEVAVINSRPR
ncbi:hypothetical protein [Actinomadura sp. DC4]|uniref:hypothetical protein n=1 Tax=Actinomadura sp. DC4 TaxID=3055069 RepID=UPI0025B129F2|nr:hypothetical protein [Actinomadura sp. DC4]MDN3357272.1 hypothetical protein [Actinomadura sp. DC4]